MWFDDQFENTFRRLSDRFFAWDDVFENPKGGQIQTYGPHYYGYQMTIGPDGKPRIKEWGNVRPTVALQSGVREPFVDQTLDEKTQTVRLVSEMPGVERSDIKVNVDDNIVSLSAQRGDRKYSTKIPLQHEVDQNSAKAKYANGILELTFTLAKKLDTGKKVLVE